MFLLEWPRFLCPHECNSIRMSVQAVRSDTPHIILNLIWPIEAINDDMIGEVDSSTPCLTSDVLAGRRNRLHNVYRQVSNIRRTKSQHLKDYHAVLRLSLPNPLKPDVRSRMKM